MDEIDMMWSEITLLYRLEVSAEIEATVACPRRGRIVAADQSDKIHASSVSLKLRRLKCESDNLRKQGSGPLSIGTGGL
jgi:hypothetical protein